MKTRIHIGLAVSDLEASKRFYSALFGCAPTKVKDDYANWRLDEPALHLALVEAPQHAKGDNPVRHFGVELFADVDLMGWRERVAQAGLTLRDEEEVVCCYAKSDKFWAKDPDGNEWEFWVRLEEADRMKETGARSASDGLTDEGACCAPSEKTQSNESQSACCTPAQKSEAQAANQGCC